MAETQILADKLKKITAVIKEISVNPAKNVGVVSVQINYDNQTWYKPFAVSFTNGIIKFSDFKARLQEEVRKDFDKDSALAELKALEGKEFNLFGD